MADLFSNHAGRQLLASLRKIFEEKRVYFQKHRLIIFVCGGGIEEEDNSLRKQFIAWAEHNLPNFLCLIVEKAFEVRFAEHSHTFINLREFESVVADVADCVLIFPESVGSYAEVGFFSNSSSISVKTLVVNRLDKQTKESFLNLGPIDTIYRASNLQTVFIDMQEVADFTQVAERLNVRVKWQRERLRHKKFGAYNVNQKLSVVFEMLNLLRLADIKSLRHALVACFGGNPTYQELRNLLRILIAAKFIKQVDDYYRVVAGVNLIKIEHLDVEVVFASVSLFYEKHATVVFEALSEVA